MDIARRGAHLLSLNRRSLRIDADCDGFDSPTAEGPAAAPAPAPDPPACPEACACSWGDSWRWCSSVVGLEGSIVVRRALRAGYIGVARQSHCAERTRERREMWMMMQETSQAGACGGVH